MKLGVIADDMTGASDIALILAREGLSVVQAIGAPQPGEKLPEADAVVVALKSRTAPLAEAVRDSLASLRALEAGGAEQIFFKYCSTFDSTDTGNIGPVADALFEALGAESAIFCPAFPANGRSIFQGNLFVNGVPLAESPMKDHPLTPMRDSNLCRVLQRQTRRGTGLIPFAVVEQGAAAVRAAIAAEAAAGRPYVIADALTDAHMRILGEAAAGAKLVTGGSALAMGLPKNLGLGGRLASGESFQAPPGRAAVFSGSCSAATRGQVRHAIATGMPALRIDPAEIAAGGQTAAKVANWIAAQPANRPCLVYATAEPEEVAKTQALLGREASGAMVEKLLGGSAALAAAAGATRIVAAGGETSGAIVQALSIKSMAIGPEIAPGVPWMSVRQGPELAITLKSGNFGQEDFFTRAFAMLAG